MILHVDLDIGRRPAFLNLRADVTTVAVKDSRIHGRGVFAARDIMAGETIIEWRDCTERLTEQQAQALPEEERKYLSFIDGQFIQFRPPARFVNHSCDPSAFGRGGRDMAVRDIAKGEEITVDYVVEQVPGLDLVCRCGANNCRKILKAPP